jgi:hypothetical protein
MKLIWVLPAFALGKLRLAACETGFNLAVLAATVEILCVPIVAFLCNHPVAVSTNSIAYRCCVGFIKDVRLAFPGSCNRAVCQPTWLYGITGITELLNTATGIAAVSLNLIAIVAIFVLQSFIVATHFFARLPFSGAQPAFFDLACRATAITRCTVAIIARFGNDALAISANWGAGGAAIIAIFGPAEMIATIIQPNITVITLLWGSADAITAQRIALAWIPIGRW